MHIFNWSCFTIRTIHKCCWMIHRCFHSSYSLYVYRYIYRVYIQYIVIYQFQSRNLKPLQISTLQRIPQNIHSLPGYHNSQLCSRTKYYLRTLKKNTWASLPIWAPCAAPSAVRSSPASCYGRRRACARRPRRCYRWGHGSLLRPRDPQLPPGQI